MNVTQITENHPIPTIMVGAVVGVAGTAYAVHVAPRVSWWFKETKRNVVDTIKSYAT